MPGSADVDERLFRAYDLRKFLADSVLSTRRCDTDYALALMPS